MKRNDDFDRYFEARHSRRLASEDRYLTRVEKREAEADALIGELERGGRTVYYINQIDRRGRFTGKIIEGPYYKLVEYLIRNRYI
jgi:hypothetical protein